MFKSCKLHTNNCRLYLSLTYFDRTVDKHGEYKLILVVHSTQDYELEPTYPHNFGFSIITFEKVTFLTVFLNYFYNFNLLNLNRKIDGRDKLEL